MSPNVRTVPGMSSRSDAVASSSADPQSLMSPAPTTTGSAAATGAGAANSEAVRNADEDGRERERAGHVRSPHHTRRSQARPWDERTSLSAAVVVDPVTGPRARDHLEAVGTVAEAAPSSCFGIIVAARPAASTAAATPTMIDASIDVAASTPAIAAPVG